MERKWPFEGRIRPLRAHVLESRWPPSAVAPARRCFGVRQDGRDHGRDALLVGSR